MMFGIWSEIIIRSYDYFMLTNYDLLWYIEQDLRKWLTHFPQLTNIVCEEVNKDDKTDTS